jgi:8-oxo-dGTP pyrophosphatase MutT (NUDIX family)
MRTFDMRAIALAVVSNESLNHVLMIKRPIAIGRHQWVFPGGKVEGSESPVQAAKREVREETGIQCKIETSKPLGWRLHPTTGVFVHYIGFFGCPGIGTIKEPEKIEGVDWITTDKVLQMVGEDIVPGVREILQLLNKGPQTVRRRWRRKELSQQAMLWSSLLG